MSTDRWQRLKKLFQQAVELGAASRADLLERLRAEDPSASI